MRCDQFMARLSQYPDGFAHEADRLDFLSHAATCEICAKMLAKQEMLMDALHSLDDDVSVPESFSASWRQAISEDAQATKTPETQKPKKRTRMAWRTLIATAATVAMVATGTALMREGLLFPSMERQDQQMQVAAEDSRTRMASPMVMPEEGLQKIALDDAGDAAPMDAVSSRFMEPTVQSAMMLHSANITLATEQYETDVSSIEALLERSGGWSETWAITGDSAAVDDASGRTANMTLRIPMHALDAFVNDVSAIGTLDGCEMYIDDISQQYYDVQGRLAMHETQRRRLTELLSRAESLSDVLEIQAQLDQVQLTMESYVSQINNWNSLSGNAIVHVSIREVSPGAAAQSKGDFLAIARDAGGRSLASAKAHLTDMLVFLIMAAPYIAAAIILWLLIVAALGAFRSHTPTKRNRRM